MNPHSETAEVLKGIARRKKALAASLQSSAELAGGPDPRLAKAIFQLAADEMELSADMLGQLAEKFAALGPLDDDNPLRDELGQFHRADERRSANRVELLQARCDSLNREIERAEQQIANIVNHQKPRRRFHRLRVFFYILRQVPTLARVAFKEYLKAYRTARDSSRLQDRQRPGPDSTI